MVLLPCDQAVVKFRICIGSWFAVLGIAVMTIWAVVVAGIMASSKLSVTVFTELTVAPSAGVDDSISA